MLEFKTARPLYTWVQPYYASQLIEEDQLASGIVDICSLQWWGAELNNIKELCSRDLTTESIEYIRSHGASPFLCVTNVTSEVPVDQAGANLSRYLEQHSMDRLLRFVDQYGFDGLDIDLESSNDHPENQFIDTLVKSCDYLKERLGERKLTVCTFASPHWKTPNTTIWPFLTADIIVSMGYDDIGVNSIDDSWSSYKEQGVLGRGLADVYQGLPGWLDSWKGSTFKEHLEAAMENSDGIALWDARDLGRLNA